MESLRQTNWQIVPRSYFLHATKMMQDEARQDSSMDAEALASRVIYWMELWIDEPNHPTAPIHPSMNNPRAIRSRLTQTGCMDEPIIPRIDAILPNIKIGSDHE